MSAQFSSLQAAKDFIFAGNSTFTVVFTKSGKRFTFNVKQPMENNKRDFKSSRFFVSVLTGSDNTSDYSYMGCYLAEKKVFSHGKKSSLSKTADSVVAFEWFANKFLANATSIPESLAIYHEGRCGRCARKLTVPSSIESGFGPECAGKFEAIGV